MRLHLHFPNAVAGFQKCPFLVGHFGMKIDDDFHHGVEVAFHDEFAKRERTRPAPVEFHPEGLFVFHGNWFFDSGRKNTALHPMRNEM